jgi:hypothetical protein
MSATRIVTLRVTITAMRGRSLMETESAMRNALARLGYVRDVSTLESKPATCRACDGGFPLEMTACPSCGRTR